MKYAPLSHPALLLQIPQSKHHLDQVAKLQLNGRQIKNVIKTAGLLAWSKGREVREFEYQVVSALLLASYYLIINTEYEVRPLVSPGITLDGVYRSVPSLSQLVVPLPI
jgi:hypothetical protein